VKRVAILQHRLLHYRTNLFDQLRKSCLDSGIELYLVHGQASRRELAKKDEGSLPWAHKVRNRFLEIGGKDIVWQPFPADLRDVHLIVVMQESRILSNYPLLFSRMWSSRKVAYWGHGANFQSDAPTGIRERWKRMILKQVDWWFAYTGMTRDILLANGYPVENITVLDNAIDNERFIEDLSSISSEELARLRNELDLSAEGRLGLFCGSLYPDKKLDFMVMAADIIHSSIPGFRLVVIGDGPSAARLRDMIKDKKWAHWVGVRKGLEKAAYFRLADVILNPGLVGLHILDAFCAGAPMFTTDNARHSPEIAYLEHSVNGFILKDDPKVYAEAVVGLLQNESRLALVRDAVRGSVKKYTLDRMVSNFVEGIKRCIKPD
jgi:glycosyltransferase involved in cell wall biosynthesis